LKLAAIWHDENTIIYIPEGDVACRAVDDGHAKHRRRSEHDDEGAPVARTDEVADGSHGEAREDGTGDGGHAAVADVGPGEAEVVSDDWDERRCREGGHHAGEEGDPGEVEGAHVRVGEGEDLHGLGLVLRVHGEVELGVPALFLHRRHLLDGQGERRLAPCHAVHRATRHVVVTTTTRHNRRWRSLSSDETLAPVRAS
jgi:hypothetical protein